MSQHIKTFVRRKGRMSSLHKKGFDLYGSSYLIPYQAEQSPEQVAQTKQAKQAKQAEQGAKLSFPKIFGNANPVIVEIGFGMGHATIQIAQEQPHYNFLGIEVHTPGVGRVLCKAGEAGLTNLKLIHHDAVEVLHHMIPEQSLSGIHLFFPDPWPKKKHHKRRIYAPGFLDMVHPLLQDNGYIYAATDWQPYGKQMLEVAQLDNRYKNPHNGFAPPSDWRPLTRFEYKGITVGHRIYEVWIEKTAVQGTQDL